MAQVAERNLGGGEVKIPHPEKPLIIKLDDFLFVLKSAFAPFLQSFGVMQPPDLQISDIKPGFFNIGRQF